MNTQSEFAAHCVELLSALGPARSRRMFGGYGFYVDDVFIALAASDRLYLKADGQTQDRFKAAGCEPFVFNGADGLVTTSYWTAPEEALESPAVMQPWARLAMEAGLRARNAKPAPRKKKLTPVAVKTKPKRAAAKPKR